MAIITYPLNGIDYDAENAETYLCTRTSGVYSADGNFQASVTGDRQVSISAGLAWIQNTEFAGKSVCNTESVAVEIPLADGTRPRIDRIVLRFDKAANASSIVLKQGTPSSAPAAPTVERTELVYELGLCTVQVPAASTIVSAGNVTSTLLNESVCGLMRDGVTGIPTEQLQEQVAALLADLRVAFENQLDLQEQDFDSWFETIKGKLGDDPATALQAQVDNLQAAVGGLPLQLSAGTNSIQITADANRLESVKVAGFTTQTGTGDPSPTNIRLIENAGADGTTFVDVNGQQTQIPLQAPLHEGDTLETNVVYNGAFKCVETHVKATVSVDGKTTLFTQDTNGYAVALPGAADGAVICNAFSGLSASSQSVTIPASAFPSTVTNLETANTWAQSQNVVIEYLLSIPKVYADTSVPIYNPQGASILSSEEGTMLTVYIRSTKELQPLTVSLNGASQGQYNGETKQDINLVVTPQSIGALHKIKYARYEFPNKQVLAQNVTLFEATQAAMGIPGNGRVVSILVESTGWAGLVPQHWSLNLGAKTVFVMLYNATQAAHTVGPVILAFYYEE